MIGHLARRFFGSLSTRPPSLEDDEWAQRWLLPAEQVVWRRMANADRRHAVVVGRDVAERIDARQRDRPIVAAALLHDCGKVDVDLGPFGRVGATLWTAMVGPERAGRGDGRIARYVRHEPIGADLLAAIGSDPVTVALVARSPAAPPDALAAITAADDAI